MREVGGRVIPRHARLAQFFFVFLQVPVSSGFGDARVAAFFQPCRFAQIAA